MVKRYPLENVNLEFLKSKVLRRGELITSYDDASGAAVTSTRRISRSEEPVDCGEYALLDLRLEELGIFSNPPPPRRSAAILEDGTTFFMNRKEDFLAFHERLAPHLKPIEIARLLVMFQTPDYQVLLEGKLS